MAEATEAFHWALNSSGCLLVVVVLSVWALLGHDQWHRPAEIWELADFDLQRRELVERPLDLAADLSLVVGSDLVAGPGLVAEGQCWCSARVVGLSTKLN
jgi:hypothetical protein